MDDEQRLMMYMMMCQCVSVMVMCVYMCGCVCGHVTDSANDTVVQYGDECRSVWCRGCVTLSLYCTVLQRKIKQCDYTVWYRCCDDDNMSSVQYIHVWWCQYVSIGTYDRWLVCILHLHFKWCKCVAFCQSEISKSVRYSRKRCAELVSVSTVMSLMDRVIDLR